MNRAEINEGYILLHPVQDPPVVRTIDMVVRPILYPNHMVPKDIQKAYMAKGSGVSPAEPPTHSPRQIIQGHGDCHVPNR